MHSQGSFSLADGEAQARLGELARQHSCWAHWRRFACHWGAQRVAASQSGRQLVWRFALPETPAREQLAELWLHPEVGPRYLGMGWLSAWKAGASRLEVMSDRFTLTFAGQDHCFDESRRLRAPILEFRLSGLSADEEFSAGWQRCQRQVGQVQWREGTHRLWVDDEPLDWFPAYGQLPRECCLEWEATRARLDLSLWKLREPALSEEEMARLEAWLLEQPHRHDDWSFLSWKLGRLIERGQPESARALIEQALALPLNGDLLDRSEFWWRVEAIDRTHQSWCERAGDRRELERLCGERPLPPAPRQLDWLNRVNWPWGALRLALRRAFLSGHLESPDLMYALWRHRPDSLAANCLLFELLIRRGKSVTSNSEVLFRLELVEAHLNGHEVLVDIPELKAEAVADLTQRLRGLS